MASLHQVKLAEECQELTAFIAPFRHSSFQRLPFGMCSASQYFQRQMNRALQGFKDVMNMTAKNLIFGSTRSEHDSRSHRVLQCLQYTRITVNRAKWTFSA